MGPKAKHEICMKFMQIKQVKGEAKLTPGKKKKQNKTHIVLMTRG